jgi:ActR/RegA family two-component response regulator
MILRWSVTAIAVAWLALAAVNEYFEVGVFEYQAQKDREALDRQLAQCRGDFKQRYECKSQLIRAAGSSSFNYWAARLGVVFGPPLALYVIYQVGMGIVNRREQAAARARRLIRLEKKAEEERLAALEEARRRKIALERGKVFREAKTAAQKARRDEPIATLVVDPSEHGGQLCKALSEHGYVAVASENPDDALIGFKTLPYRLVVTETEFGGDGMPIGEAIREMREQAKDLKIVAISEKFPGMAANTVQDSAQALGADVGFPKPVDAQIFAQIARRLLEVKVKSPPAEHPSSPAPGNAPTPPSTDMIHESPPRAKN